MLEIYIIILYQLQLQNIEEKPWTSSIYSVYRPSQFPSTQYVFLFAICLKMMELMLLEENYEIARENDFYTFSSNVQHKLHSF